MFMIHFNKIQGKNCEKRVDECALFRNTTAGCQNNASCTNNKDGAGFQCHCPVGFHGNLCQQSKNSCDYSLDLCGEHGHCVPSNEAVFNFYKYFWF